MKKLNVISRKYWNRQPCNIKHSKKKLFSKEYFNEVSKKRYFVEGHIKNFVNFKKWKNKKVLEIGFGIGTDEEIRGKEMGYSGNYEYEVDGQLRSVTSNKYISAEKLNYYKNNFAKLVYK